MIAWNRQEVGNFKIYSPRITRASLIFFSVWNFSHSPDSTFAMVCVMMASIIGGKNVWNICKARILVIKIQSTNFSNYFSFFPYGSERQTRKTKKIFSNFNTVKSFWSAENFDLIWIHREETFHVFDFQLEILDSGKMKKISAKSAKSFSSLLQSLTLIEIPSHNFEASKSFFFFAILRCPNLFEL